MTKPKTLTADHGRALAGDLIRALAPVSGDGAAVDAQLQHWLAVLDARDLSLVCIAAIQTLFTDCLTPTPVDQIPAHRLVLVTPPERKQA